MATTEDATDEVFTLQFAKEIDGLNMPTTDYKILFEKKIDDVCRLKAGDDTLIATYPRTGTAWVGQIVSLLLASDEKYEQIRNTRIERRVLYLEFHDEGKENSRMEEMKDVPPPRALKTHLPYRFIRRWIDEDNVKTILTTRNPKDILVSLYHFYRARAVYGFGDRTWDDFFKHVQAGKVLYGDPYEWLKDWDDNRDKGQLLFVKFEDMKKDVRGQINRIIAFLGLNVTEERIQQVMFDSDLKQMQKDLKQVPGFKAGTYVRGGQRGEWKKFFTVAQNEWFDNKYKKLYESLNIDVHYE